MRLQIKRLEGPNEIQLSTSTQTSFPTTVGANDAEDRFTCYFNRAIDADDIFPATVTIHVYNRDGVDQGSFPLVVTRNMINDADANANFCFTITINCPETLSGSYFYIHTILTNADTNAENVSYGVSSYHETIKKVYIYAQKQFLQVYWSSVEQITYEEQQATRESVRTGSIGQNEDAFLHVKTIGMYDDQVVLLLSADDGQVELRRETFSMKQNRRVIAFDMAETIQRYRQQTNQPEGNVSFTLKATLSIPNPNAGEGNVTTQVAATVTNTNVPERGWGEAILVTIAQILTAPLWILSSCSSGPRDATNGESTQVNPNNIIQSSTELLTVNCTDANPATKRTSTGTVYVNVVTGETPDIVPTKFRDFTIGFMCHIEGIGRVVNKESNIGNNTARYTVYPLNVYEILLSDLVVCGLVTIDEAAYLTTRNHDCINLRTRADLQNTFNKLEDQLSQSKTLISIFRDENNANRAKRDTIRKVLAQVSVKNHYFSNNQHEYNNVREICRDAWQKVSRKSGVITKLHSRPDSLRYSKNKECPSGDYFLNYIAGTYCAYVSSNPNNKNIDTFPEDLRVGRQASLNPVDRGGIALHKGGSRFSTGCLTFNIPYEGGNYAYFTNRIFPDEDRVKNVRKLNFICIDERNAIQISNNDTDRYNGVRRQVLDTSTDRLVWLENQSYNFYRYYDLIEPNSDLGLNF